MKLRLLTGMLIAVTLLAAACGGSSKKTTDKQPVKFNPNVPLRVNTDTNKLKDVMVTGCNQVQGGWAASGTATNHGKASESYLITIFFTTPGSTDEGSSETTITVPAGKTGNWSLDPQFAAVPDTRCVLRAVS